MFASFQSMNYFTTIRQQQAGLLPLRTHNINISGVRVSVHFRLLHMYLLHSTKSMYVVNLIWHTIQFAEASVQNNI